MVVYPMADDMKKKKGGSGSFIFSLVHERKGVISS
jgi:hypothetical protein